MNMRIAFLLPVLVIVSLLLSSSKVSNAQLANCLPCEQMKRLNLPEVTIHTAIEVSAEIENEDNTTTKRVHCKVLGVIGKEINFELLLPSDFNGRFAMSGGGGFVSGVSNHLKGLTKRGYATAGTDVGHREHDPATWASNNMERQLNFGHLAIHRTAVVCKNLIARYYGASPAYSYFVGTSRGGGQAMMEAQRYPEDFDGMVAGAPAFNWTAFSSKFVQIAQHMYPDGALSAPVIGKQQLALLEAKILEQCDQLDGVRDSILSDPAGCPFDIDGLPGCEGDVSGPDCFTAAQIEALRTVYTPLLVNGKQIHPGFPIGGENEPGGWLQWISGAQASFGKYPSAQAFFGISTFKYLIFNDEDWDYASYRFDKLIADTEYASHYLDATSTDYQAFKERGGKLLIWQGWADPGVSALGIIDHYKEAKKNDPELDQYMRLFVMPGVLHGPGRGPDKVDWLSVLQDWVESGIAPDRVVASKKMGGGKVLARPIYPYPRKAQYDGKGDPMNEASFIESR